MTHQCSHERAPASAHASAHASVHESAHKSWLSLCYNPIHRLPLECSRECSRGCPRKCTRSGLVVCHLVCFHLLCPLPTWFGADSDLKSPFSGQNPAKTRSKSDLGEGFGWGSARSCRSSWNGPVAPPESLDVLLFDQNFKFLRCLVRGFTVTGLPKISIPTGRPNGIVDIEKLFLN